MPLSSSEMIILIAAKYLIDFDFRSGCYVLSVAISWPTLSTNTLIQVASQFLLLLRSEILFLMVNAIPPSDQKRVLAGVTFSQSPYVYLGSVSPY